MHGICGADCGSCAVREDCHGCRETCGSPFGGRCVAAEWIRIGGVASYQTFRAELLDEVNRLLRENGIPEADALYELHGKDVNLSYLLPSGEAVRFLDDRNIYLGTQISFADLGICYGVVADAGFILICSYSVDGSLPELVAYCRR